MVNFEMCHTVVQRPAGHYKISFAMATPETDKMTCDNSANNWLYIFTF